MSYLLHVRSLLTVALLIFCTSCATKTVGKTNKNQSSESIDQYSGTKIHDETDKTDIFAIPLDNSQIGEEADAKLRKELEAEQKAQKKKK